jgi:hypothetical protein
MIRVRVVASTVAALIIIPIIAFVGVRLYQYRCFGSRELTPALVRGSERCSLLDVNLLAADSHTFEFDAPVIYNDGDPESVIVKLSATFSLTDLHAIVPAADKFYRLRFGTPARVESLPGLPTQSSEVDFNRTGQLGVSVYGEIKREESFWAWLFPPYGRSGSYVDGAYCYPAAGGDSFGHAYHSPGGELLVLTSRVAANLWNSDAYVEVFRRRDHRSLALLQTNCCGRYDPSFADQEHGWVSPRHFVWITGTFSSSLFACTFES